MHQLQKALQLFLPARISPFRTLCVGGGKPTRFIIAGQSFYSGNKKSPFHQDEDSRFHLILHIHCCIYLIGYHGYPCSVTGTPGFIYLLGPAFESSTQGCLSICFIFLGSHYPQFAERFQISTLPFTVFTIFLRSILL